MRVLKQPHGSGDARRFDLISVLDAGAVALFSSVPACTGWLDCGRTGPAGTDAVNDLFEISIKTEQSSIELRLLYLP